MKNIEVNKIAVSNNISFGNNDFFIYFTGHKDTKKLDLYAYFFQI